MVSARIASRSVSPEDRGGDIAALYRGNFACKEAADVL
jgi:hypothetical protein